jgi:hypothetical protein
MKIVLKGLIWLLIAALLVTLYSLLAWYGFIKTSNGFMGFAASVILIYVPCYLITEKIMKHVNID